MPLAYRYDAASSTFQLSFTTTRADGHGRFGAGAVTTVATPPGQYPHGYRTTVSGAHVTSAPNAGVLTLAADPGATEIKVTVQPA